MNAMTEPVVPGAVYSAINTVRAELADIGIAKGQRNREQGYQFRGIDDVYNVISPILSKAGLCILPRIISRESAERTTKKGSLMYVAIITMEFDFVCVADGSRHTVSACGEGMDTGDKATPKAMSGAMKCALLQTFTIPTVEGVDPDADDNGEVSDAILKCEKQIKAAPNIQALQKVWKIIADFYKDDPKAIEELNGYKDQRARELENGAA